MLCTWLVVCKIEKYKVFVWHWGKWDIWGKNSLALLLARANYVGNLDWGCHIVATGWDRWHCVEIPGKYTWKKLKAYKSVEAYNYVISDLFGTCYYRFMKVAVRPSQQLFMRSQTVLGWAEAEEWVNQCFALLMHSWVSISWVVFSAISEYYNWENITNCIVMHSGT